MRNLFKKSLTLCLVAILAFSCFAGIVSAETAYTATIAVVDQTITQGTTSVDVTLNITSSEVGINEALIEVSSPLGTIATEATLVSYTTANKESASIQYPKGSTNFGSFYLSVADDLSTSPSTMGSLSAAVQPINNDQSSHFYSPKNFSFISFILPQVIFLQRL